MKYLKKKIKNLYYNEKNLPDKSDNSLLNNFPLILSGVNNKNKILSNKIYKNIIV